MNKKIFYLSLVTLLITGCSKTTPLEFSPFEEYEEVRDMMIDYEDEYFYRLKDTKPVSHKDGEINNVHDLLKISRTGRERNALPSKGERKVLVVPIYFTDSDTSSLDDKTIFIKNAFFGKSDKTEYDSVVGYYNKTSYGQLKISGEVAPWFNVGIKSSDWKDLSTSHSTASSIIVEKAVDFIKANNLMDLTQFDTDGDNNIDAVYAIYDHPFDQTNASSSLYWAYAYYTFEGENGLNKTAPFVNDYAWTSVNSITDVGERKDNKSYTNYLIHETGHLLGLNDYYNTGGSENHYQPTGSFDMMDYNIGDHSSFSKYLLKWTSPLVLKHGSSFTYDLKPFITSGEYILVPSKKYTDSPYGEYMLLEFFVPEGMNRYEEQFEYITPAGQKLIYRYPNHYGLKIYHVNAYLGYYQIGVGRFNYLAALDDPDYEEKIKGYNTAIDYLYDNSPSDYQVRQNRPVLYHLLESSGDNTFKNGVPANNNTLFKTGSDFGYTKFIDYKFDSGESVGLKLKVKAVSSSYIRLEIDFE